MQPQRLNGTVTRRSAAQLHVQWTSLPRVGSRDQQNSEHCFRVDYLAVQIVPSVLLLVECKGVGYLSGFCFVSVVKPAFKEQISHGMYRKYLDQAACQALHKGYCNLGGVLDISKLNLSRQIRIRG